MIDSHGIARQLNLPQVGLINDWEAGAYGIAALETKDFEVLNQGELAQQKEIELSSPRARDLAK